LAHPLQPRGLAEKCAGRPPFSDHAALVWSWCGPGVVSRHAKTTHPLLIGTSALSTAETAARELGTLSLSDALSLCRLYERDRDPWSERAIRRWISRMRRECALRHEQVGLLVVAAGLLRTEFRQLALNVLLTARGELRRARADATEK
jgi:hypothetical protein